MGEKTDKERGDRRPGLAAAQKLNYQFFGIGFLIAFGLAFLLAWILFSPPPAPPPVPAPTLTADDTRDFFAAVEANDFDAMKKLGGDLFTVGARIPDSRKVLSDFETTSYDPHIVYAFYSYIGADKTRRVLLTMDADDRVVSFLAEEMDIAP